MAIDLVKNTTHVVFFPSKMLAGMGGAHQYNITLTANHDNGTLVGRGAWNSFDNYTEGAVAATNDFAGIIRQVNPDDSTLFYVEATADSDLLIVYNSPKSEYPEAELQNLKLFYNKAGETVRAYSIRKGDIFMLSVDAFTGADPAANKTLTFKNGKYVVA